MNGDYCLNKRFSDEWLSALTKYITVFAAVLVIGFFIQRPITNRKQNSLSTALPHRVTGKSEDESERNFAEGNLSNPKDGTSSGLTGPKAVATAAGCLIFSAAAILIILYKQTQEGIENH